MQKANFLTSIEKTENYFHIKTDNPEAKLYFMTDDILRLRVSFDKKFTEESYQLVTTAWDDRFDDFLGDERVKIAPVDVKFTEKSKSLIFETKTMKVKITKNPFSLEIFDLEGNKIYSDLKGRSYVQDHLGRLQHYNEIKPNDYFYGFGETTGEINKFGKYMRMSPKDSIGYDPVATSCLYKHIPFYIKLNEQTKQAIGVFYHNTYESVFNMANERSGYWPYYSYFETEGGDLDIFFINGPSISDIVSRYTDLTGKTAMPPKHTLGYLGSTMYYVELPKDCDDAIINFVDKNKKHNIPIDGFMLSSGYSTGDDNKRYVFTWNKERVKDPKKFFTEMKKRGASVCTNIKPGILTTHPDFEKMVSRDVFVKDAHNHTEPTIGKWWGGPGAFFDFTNPSARKMWSEYLRKELFENGAESVWNDNCEYDSIEDRNAKCSFDGAGGTIGQLKAVLPNIMAKVGNDTLKEYDPNIRPYAVNRGGAAGIQRYSQTWAGDNSTSWKSLKYNIATILGMGLSGVANNGCDIGGFFGSAPNDELLIRWVQNGIFQPRFSLHSCNNDNTVTEPWMYKEMTEHIANAIKFRYTFIPLYYSLLYEAHTFGAPILRPLFYEFQQDEKCFENGVDFMVGESLLVANVVEEGATTRKVYFPKGCNWYDFYTRKMYKGGEEIEIPVDITSIPMFIRDCAIIPQTRGLMNITNEDINNLDIIIATDRDCQFTIYEDDGKTQNFKNGDYLKTTVKVTSGEKVNISFENDGSFESCVKTINLDVISPVKAPFWVEVNGRKLEQFLHRDKWEESEEGWYYSASQKSAKIKYNQFIGDYNVVISYELFNLIGVMEDDDDDN